MCQTHYARKSRGQPLVKACIVCGVDIFTGGKGVVYCSEACRATPQPNPQRTGACVVCGADVMLGTNSRKHCSDGCKQADYRHRKAGGRPVESTCGLCGKAFSLNRSASGRLQRTDTIWCRDCGRESPEALRFKRYGITPERYAEALAEGCEICHRKASKLHIDHDHDCCPARTFRTCGKCVRGLICGPCNRALGMFKDDVGALQRAIDYLNTHALRGAT